MAAVNEVTLPSDGKRPQLPVAYSVDLPQALCIDAGQTVLGYQMDGWVRVAPNMPKWDAGDRLRRPTL